MPEFMLTSDASNANYASTMVAEGPAVRMFQRLQAEQLADDLEVMWRVVAGAVAMGRLPSEVETTVEINGVAPTLTVRDQLKRPSDSNSKTQPAFSRRKLGASGWAWTTARSKRISRRHAAAYASRSKARRSRSGDAALGCDAAKLSGVAENQG